MIVHLITDNKDLAKLFKNGKETDLQKHDSSEIASVTKEHWGLFYFDLKLWTETSWSQNIKKMLDNPFARIGLIDSEGWISDPAGEFHQGIVDYLGPDQLKTPVTVKRYKQVWSFNSPQERKLNLPDDIPYSGINWEKVEIGKEYLFGFLFIALDDDKKLRNNLGPQRSSVYSQDFHNYLSQFFEMWDGYLWILNDFGALILFPFDGKHFFPVEAALELSLNSDFTHFSRFHAKTSFRMVAHCGSTVYRKRGDTGKMISDTLNSIYHLGNKWAEPDSLLLSEEAYRLIPDSLKPYFLQRGEFEGRETYRLKERY